jgi:hypothetical protein
MPLQVVIGALGGDEGKSCIVDRYAGHAVTGGSAGKQLIQMEITGKIHIPLSKERNPNPLVSWRPYA